MQTIQTPMTKVKRTFFYTLCPTPFRNIVMDSISEAKIEQSLNMCSMQSPVLTSPCPHTQLKYNAGHVSQPPSTQ